MSMVTNNPGLGKLAGKPPGLKAQDGEASDHEYAEIAEDALEAEEAQGAVEPSVPEECRVCNELVMLVTFLPCRHKVLSTEHPYYLDLITLTDRLFATTAAGR